MSSVFVGRRKLLLVAWLLVVSGCVRSCSCEDQAAEGKAAVQKPAAEPSAASNELSAKQIDDVKRLSEAVGTEKNDPAAPPEPPPPPPLPADVSEVFPDAASDRKERVAEKARLTAVQKELWNKTSSSSDAVAARDELLPLFSATVHGYKAQAEPMDGPTEAGDAPVRVVSRLYKKGDAELYLKITDTSKAAFMRTPVLERLLHENGEDDGYMHGRFVDGHPAVAQYYPDAKRSQLTALVEGRYLVEIRMAPARSAYEAQEVFASLPLTKLAAAGQAPRKPGK